MFGLLDRIHTKDRGLNRALRPESFEDYIGQQELITRLKIAIQAAKERNEPLDHCLLAGPPGLGKTTISHIIAKESECNFHSVVATAIKTTADAVELLVKLEDRDILLIDEIHALTSKVEETLYSAMEDYKISVKLPNKQIALIDVEPFCLIGATTSPGKMAAPLRDRFGINYSMRFYNEQDLAIIIAANIHKLNLSVDSDRAILDIATKSRGTPRIANRLLRRVRDYVQIHNNNNITQELVNKALAIEGIDADGMSELDRKYMYTVYSTYNCGPVGIASVASSTGEDRSTIEEYIEPYLVRKQFIARTKSGRVLTVEGMRYVIDKIIPFLKGK